jgi:hypothetical protein
MISVSVAQIATASTLIKTSVREGTALAVQADPDRRAPRLSFDQETEAQPMLSRLEVDT